MRLTSCSLRAAEHQDEIWLPNRAPPDSGFGLAVARALARALGNNRAGVFLGFFRAAGVSNAYAVEALTRLGFEDLKRQIADFAQGQKAQEAMAALRNSEFLMLEHMTQECDKFWRQVARA